jgi:hypothetical protein
MRFNTPPKREEQLSCAPVINITQQRCRGSSMTVLKSKVHVQGYGTFPWQKIAALSLIKTAMLIEI